MWARQLGAKSGVNIPNQVLKLFKGLMGLCDLYPASQDNDGDILLLNSFRLLSTII